MNELMAIILIWGAWVLIPVVVDGVGTLVRLFVVLLYGRNYVDHDISRDRLPTVTVIIPAHNEEKIIDRCLNSLKIQDYPHEKLEVFVVDDGSTDNTVHIVSNHVNGNGKNGNGKNGNGKVKINGKFIPVGDFSGVIKLFTSGHKGKAAALNTGIRHAHGEIIMNIDSDVVLAQDAIRHMAEEFIVHPELGAATGNIEINWEMIEERDTHGNLIFENGEIKQKRLNFLERMLASCQFLEYLSAFRLGRQYQSILNSEYILSGAFSAFRRTVLLKSPLYSSRTVSEDFDLALSLHRQHTRVGYVADAKAYVEPVCDLDMLYAQRVRWRRGQLEVCGLYKDMVGEGRFGYLGRLGLPGMLLADHTVAFPRMVWSVLILFFPLLGYHPNVIAIFLVIMFGMYVVLDFAQTMAAYFIVDSDTKRNIEGTFHYNFILPFYRLLIFYFRMSGYLIVLKDPPSWHVGGPMNGFKNGIKKLNDAALSHSLVFFLKW